MAHAYRRRSKTVVTPKLFNQIVEDFIGDKSIEAIGQSYGMGTMTVRSWLDPIINILRASDSLPVNYAKFQSCPSKRDKISPEKIAQVQERLKTAYSIRQLAREMDLDKATVKSIAKPLIASMQQAGTLGLCECGRERFHPRICVRTAGAGKSSARAPDMERRSEILAAIISGQTFAKISADFGMADKSGARSYLKFLTNEQREQRKTMEGARRGEDHLRKRAAIVAQIRRGDTFSRIGEQWGISATAAAAYRRWLSPDQLERRKALEQVRCSYAVSVETVRPYCDPLYARIAAAMPRWLSEATRDDAISDIYVAVLEGDLLPEDIGSSALRYARRAASRWESRFGPRSLDDAAFEGSRDTLGARIADPDSLIPFENREAEEA